MEACDEKHAACLKCYLKHLGKEKRCPCCEIQTSTANLVGCLALEKLIGQMEVRCKNGFHPASVFQEPSSGPVGQGGAGGGAAPPTTCAKDDPAVSMDIAKGGETCGWTGKVCELAEHLAVCGYERGTSPNAVAGWKCTDVADHAMQKCTFKKCMHCGMVLAATALAEHEAICPQKEIPWPTAMEVVRRALRYIRRRRC